MIHFELIGYDVFISMNYFDRKSGQAVLDLANFDLVSVVSSFVYEEVDFADILEDARGLRIWLQEKIVRF